MGSLTGSTTGVELPRDHGRQSSAEQWSEFVASGAEASGHHVSLHSGLPVHWSAAGAVPSARGGWQLKAKRALDIVGALSGLVFLAPLMAIVAIAIKATSPGPVFFKQQREGINGRIFYTFKFRSMAADLGDATGVVQTQANDARVTPIGRFIRKTSIDELPQLINVLWGDMSLVGPRPHVPGMLAGGQLYKDLVPYYDRRLEMLPGITGWAQVNGFRGPTRDPRKARQRIDHDLAYIQNFSIWLDIRIIVMTIAREFVTGSGD